MAALFDVGVPAISKHLANVFETGELKEEATISKMETVQQENSQGDRPYVRIAEHLQNAFSTGELTKDSVCRKFRRTATDGKEYNTQYYNLDAVISVGYRVNT